MGGMDPVTKIGTCCYCGTRAMLTLRGETRHELSCATCGAPLHNMKQVKREVETPRHVGAAGKRAKGQKPKAKVHKPHKTRKSKKRGWGYWVREVFDELEDIFD